MRARDIRQNRQDERKRERTARQAAGRNTDRRRRFRRLRRRFFDLVLRTAGPFLVRTLAWTWRVERRGESGYELLRSDDPWVGVVWHGRLLAGLPLKHHAHRKLGILVSPSEDGKLAGIALRKFGYHLIRGSSSRGGAQALREMGETIAAGKPITITPDGPRGPHQRMNSGPVWLAHHSGAPLLTFSFAVRHAWRLRSWDHFTIPKPFARILITYGDPNRGAADADEMAIEATTTKVQQQLLDDERAGAAALGVNVDP